MDFRKSDLAILAGLVLAVAAAFDLANLYHEHRIIAGGAIVGLVVFAYMTGLRRGITRKQV